MKYLALAFASICMASLVSNPAFSQQAAADPYNMQCNIGPITKTYGLTPWFVYSCDDKRSVLIGPADGNPAAPYYFLLSPEGTGHHITGKGKGPQKFTDAALKDLQALSEPDIAKLIEQTKNPPR